jgi:large-conductance mechanosensitive channel
MPASCEHGNKPSVFINYGEFLDKLTGFSFIAIAIVCYVVHFMTGTEESRVRLGAH